MGVAIAVAGTLALSGLLALMVVYAPRFGIRNRPGTALSTAIVATEVALGALVTLIAAPAIFRTTWSGSWSWIVTDYFLAMAHRLIDGPYPFFWTPGWMYSVGSLMPFIALGSSVAVAAGLVALPGARRASTIVVAIASCMLAAYIAAGVYAAIIITRSGVPL